MPIKLITTTQIEGGKDIQSLFTIGKVLSFDNKTDYTFTDVNASKYEGGDIYYRIKQVDKDGKFSYSFIKKLSLDKSIFTFGVSSSPVAQNALRITLQSPDNNNGLLKIFDLTGKQLYQKKVSWSAGYSEQIIELPVISKGVYVASLSTTNSQLLQARFLR